MIRINAYFILNEIGQAFFPSWLLSLEKALQKQPGFIQLIELPSTTPSSASLTLDFESQEALTKWANSALHQQLVSALEPHLIEKRTEKNSLP